MNNLKWVVVTINKNDVEVAFVRERSTRVYFCRNTHQYEWVAKVIKTCIKYGYAHQETVHNKLYYSPNPIPEEA